MISSCINSIPAAIHRRSRQKQSRKFHNADALDCIDVSKTSGGTDVDKAVPALRREVHFPERLSAKADGTREVQVNGVKYTSVNSSVLQRQASYVPRKSPRLSNKVSQVIPDGNTWVELRVVSRKNPAKSRSLFYSINSRHAFWDEPPTGASEVVTLDDLDRLQKVVHRFEQKQQSSIVKTEVIEEEAEAPEPDTPDASLAVPCLVSSNDDSAGTDSIACTPGWPVAEHFQFTFDILVDNFQKSYELKKDEELVNGQKELSLSAGTGTIVNAKSTIMALLLLLNTAIVAAVLSRTQQQVDKSFDFTLEINLLCGALLLQSLLFLAAYSMQATPVPYGRLFYV